MNFADNFLDEEYKVSDFLKKFGCKMISYESQFDSYGYMKKTEGTFLNEKNRKNFQWSAISNRYQKGAKTLLFVQEIICPMWCPESEVEFWKII